MKKKVENNGILLETGTNEIEIMQFTIDDILYGINVAKVKEIIRSEPVKPMPHVHPAVEGIFKPRDVLITVVDLPYYVTDEHLEKSEKDLFIITNSITCMSRSVCTRSLASAAFPGRIFPNRIRRLPAVMRALQRVLRSAAGNW